MIHDLYFKSKFVIYICNFSFIKQGKMNISLVLSFSQLVPVQRPPLEPCQSYPSNIFLCNVRQFIYLFLFYLKFFNFLSVVFYFLSQSSFLYSDIGVMKEINCTTVPPFIRLYFEKILYVQVFDLFLKPHSRIKWVLMSYSQSKFQYSTSSSIKTIQIGLEICHKSMVHSSVFQQWKTKNTLINCTKTRCLQVSLVLTIL